MTSTNFDRDKLDSLEKWIEGFALLPKNERAGFALIQIMLGIVGEQERTLSSHSSWHDLHVGEYREGGFSESIQLNSVLEAIRRNEDTAITVDFLSDGGNKFSLTLTHVDGALSVVGKIHEARS